MKISQPIFGILVALTKNEVMKICNEPGNDVEINWEIFYKFLWPSENI